MKSPISYYFDEACNDRYPVNESGQAIIDWGETIPGQKKEKTLYAKNESRDKLVIRQPYTADEDLKIKDFPPRLFTHESGKVVLEFIPNKERIDALHADWGFDVIVG